jgi:hypothetical protein
MSPSRVAVAVGCVLVSTAAGCSSHSSEKLPSNTPVAASAPVTTIRGELIPGIGATRASWDASHTPNPASNNGAEYGDDPSLPSYLTDDGAVYRDVDDQGTGTIHGYTLVMHTVDAQQALRQLRQELPADATIAWHLTRDQCYRVAFNSPSLRAAGPVMAEAELEYIQEDGSKATSPDQFNLASIWLNDAGAPPDPQIGC